MENATTRIADLPMDGGTPAYSAMLPNSINVSKQPNDSGLPTNYIPINVHPNPYGNTTQNPPAMSNPVSQQQQQQFMPPPPQSQYLTEEQQMQLTHLQHQRVPSRDIHQDTTTYSQDEQIQPNYIPKSRDMHDYVREREDMTEKNVREYEAKKRQVSRLDTLLTEFQTPIFVTILFFFYQLPMINTLIFKRFSFLAIYNNDGNFNFFGLLFKSILFGCSYYFVYKITEFLSEF